MFHRHLTAEAFERALEENPGVAADMRRRAARCQGCDASLALVTPASLLAQWQLPPAANQPLDWHSALASAIAPANIPMSSRHRPRRLLLATTALVLLLMALAVPAAASSGPDSLLFPVRGATDDLRWRATARSDQPRLEADLAAAYLWEARVSASRRDRAGYRAAMERVFIWSDRLKTDVSNSAPADRSQIRATVTAGKSLLPALGASEVDEHQAGQVESVLNNVQGQAEQDGEHSGGG